MSIDPVTTDANTGGSFNRDAYANNSPYKYIDPDGRIGLLAFAVKGADLTITGVELYGAWETGGASALAVAAGQNYLANLVPGMKTGSYIFKTIGKIGTKGASGLATAKSGKQFLGNSKNSATSGGDATAPMQKDTQDALNAIAPEDRSRSHGKCCEIDITNKMKIANEEIKGASMGPVKDNKSGDILPTCDSCRQVMEKFEMKF